MLLKKNYLLFLLLIFIILINKNIFAAPLCFEEEDGIKNKEFTINENSLEKNNDSNKNNNLEETKDENEKEEMQSKIQNIKKVTVSKDKQNGVPQEHEDPVLENKHQDLFEELFGDKS